MPDRISVPFTIEPTVRDYRTGVVAIRGILGCRDGALRVEWQTKNARWQDSDPVAVSIALRDVQSVEFHRRLGRSELRIHGHSLTTFQHISGHRGDHLRLRIAARDVAAAQNAASLLRLLLEQPSG